MMSNSLFQLFSGTFASAGPVTWCIMISCYGLKQPKLGSMHVMAAVGVSDYTRPGPSASVPAASVGRNLVRAQVRMAGSHLADPIQDYEVGCASDGSNTIACKPSYPVEPVDGPCTRFVAVDRVCWG